MFPFGAAPIAMEQLWTVYAAAVPVVQLTPSA
jgi:hypothetical protein